MVTNLELLFNLVFPPSGDGSYSDYATLESILDGFLCIDKPSGVTSRDVVNQVQRLVRPTKVGHAGTLDPLATGVLVVALGRATRLVCYVQRMAKTYDAVFLLGKTSQTEDITGELVERAVPVPPSLKDITTVCDKFVGETLQRPPAFSALKVSGKRSYELARAGKSVELPARPIVIHRIAVLHYAFPELQLEVECGSGTYIRSLGRDIGELLECGAVMSALRRSRIGEFRIGDACLTASIDRVEAVRDALRPARDGVAELPTVELSEEQHRALAYGTPIHLHHCSELELAGIDASGRLAAVLSRTDAGAYRPSVNFVAR